MTRLKKDIQVFENILGSKRVIRDPFELDIMNTDWTNRWKGNSQLALFPTSTEEVSALLAYCNEKRLAVVPQAGRTGLIGGSIPIFDEIILSVKKMNCVGEFDDINGILSGQAGCIADNLSSYLKSYGYDLPYALASSGSCMLGGNIATNAGGSKQIRHGSLRSNVVGLEAVLADGTILNDMSTIRKNNSGYDLKQLFIGSEGTLGIITQAAITCPLIDAKKYLAMVAVKSFPDCVELLKLTKQTFRDTLSAFEFMDLTSMQIH